MLFVVEATGCLHSTFQVHFSLVSNSVDICGTIRPCDTGHTTSSLHIPATNINHTSSFTFTTWWEEEKKVSSLNFPRDQKTADSEMLPEIKFNYIFP